MNNLLKQVITFRQCGKTESLTEIMDNKKNKSKFQEYWNSLGKNVIKDEDMGMVEVYAEGAFDYCKNEVLRILNNHEDNDGFSKDVLLEKINKL